MLTRGDVQFAKDEDKLRIHVPQNCTVLHPGDCHHAAQHTEEGKIACLRQMAFFESYDALHAWLTEIAFALRSRIPVDERRFLIGHHIAIEKVDGLYMHHQERKARQVANTRHIYKGSTR
ncbi:MAG: hypothetical protein PHQ40_02235 [Anaerolineaceae bacterium]|nr:hypothetical protein [Anaerolineaceae bacterium]